MNYALMGLGILVIIGGFMLMAGGRQEGNEFHPEQIYSFRRITLAPIVVTIGFIIEVIAVLRKPKFGIRKSTGSNS